jgi:uncharacterized protein
MTTDLVVSRHGRLLAGRGELVERPALRFLLTDTCNLRCTFCHNEFQGDMGCRPRQAWDWDSVRALLAGAGAQGRPKVKISGGEPTLRWSTLLQLMRVSRDAAARDLTLFSNLTLLSETKVGTLKDAGLNRVTTNLPSFRSEVFASRTDQDKWPLDLVLRNAGIVRAAGINVQFNLVVPRVGDESTVKAFLLAELSAADACSATWDTIALVTDDWSPKPIQVQSWIRQWLMSDLGLVERTDRPHRSYEFVWGGRRLLASRCTSWSREQERAEADLYVVAPGRILHTHVRGRAYRTAPGAVDGQETRDAAEGCRVLDVTGQTPDSIVASASDDEVLGLTSEFVRSRLANEPTGHDWWHALRVRKLACHIAYAEGADVQVVELAALLHDIADAKFSGSDDEGPRIAAEWLRFIKVDETVVCATRDIIAHISFKGAVLPDELLSPEGACVRDADRLDAMGAIGIARTFAYGGFVRRPIHDPEQPPLLHDSVESYRGTLGTSINHFHEKLLLLQNRLVTPTGRALGRRRHQLMVDFLREFQADWDGWTST